MIRASLVSGEPTVRVMVCQWTASLYQISSLILLQEAWDLLQLTVALYINSEVPHLLNQVRSLDEQCCVNLYNTG